VAHIYHFYTSDQRSHPGYVGQLAGITVKCSLAIPLGSGYMKSMFNSIVGSNNTMNYLELTMKTTPTNSGLLSSLFYVLKDVRLRLRTYSPTVSAHQTCDHTSFTDSANSQINDLTSKLTHQGLY